MHNVMVFGVVFRSSGFFGHMGVSPSLELKKPSRTLDGGYAN